METVLIVVHLMIVIALVGVVLLQRSEGGGLGIGGGGGGGFMTARGAANALTRVTGILAAAFFATSLALSVYARYNDAPGDIIDRIEQNAPAGTGENGLLDAIGGAVDQAPAVPEDTTQVPTTE